MKGFAAGVLALIALQALVSSTLPGLGAALSYPAQLAAKWMDPTVPLIGAAVPPAGVTASAGAGTAAIASAAQAAARGALTLQQQGQQAAGISG